ncbi:MAG: carboxypeptidase-like regulatory domain-containing protein [Bacteroidia bacterium]
MKISLNIFIAIAAIIFFSACRKITRETSVSGHVYDACSQATIPFAHITLSKSDDACNHCGSSVEMDTYTDANGFFSLNYKAERHYLYSVNASVNNYISDGVNSDNFKNNDNKKILLHAKVYVKVHIKNTTPFDVNDQIDVEYIYTSQLPYEYHGTAVDTTIVLEAMGCTNHDLRWTVKKNGITTNYDATINCNTAPLDTTLYNISY